MRQRILIGIILSLTAATLGLFYSGSLSASVLFTALPDTSQFVLGSNLGEGEQQTADRFILATDATLESITWYGGVFGGSDTNNGQRRFTVRLYEDAGGLPTGSPFFEQSVVASVGDTGLIMHSDCCPSSMPIFVYSTDIARVMLSAQLVIWLSVLNEDPVGQLQWVWQATAPVPGGYVALRNSDGATPAWADWQLSGEPVRNAMAFEIDGAVTPVPIPAVGWLLGSALGVLGWVRRKSFQVSFGTT